MRTLLGTRGLFMAILRCTVVLGGSSPYADTAVNRKRMFVFGSASAVSSVFGNIPHKVPGLGLARFDLNNPWVPGAVSVTSYSPVRFDSADLSGQAGLAGQLADAVDAGYLTVYNETAASSVDRTALMAFV